MITETELAYAAGIFDGEGTVGITVAKNGYGTQYHRLMLSITGCDLRLIEWIYDRFGGVIHAPRYEAKDEWRTAHRIHLADGHAKEFLQAVRPYLVIKGEQADIAIRFQETKGRPGGSVSDEVKDEREEMRQAIMVLNHGGHE